MKTGRRLIALNLAILLTLTLLTLFPMSAAAAGSQTLTIGTPIVTTELYDAGYSFTPAETGLYKFEVSCYNETENRVASCGDLQIYGGADSSAWNGIEDKNDNYTTYSKTRQLTAGTTYTIDFMGHPGLRDDPDTYRYTLSVERVVCGTLSSSPSRFNTSDGVYYQFTPSSTGWYTIALTVSGTVRLYDQDFNNIGTAYVEAGSGGAAQTEYSEYLTGGDTYYIRFTSGSTTSGTISCAPSEFGSVTTEETKTIWLGGALTYLTFTAATSGSHTITAAIGTVNDSMYLTSLGLYSATGEQLDGEWFKEGEMSIDITRDLEAGMTYYIAAGGYGGPVTVSVAAPGSVVPPSADYAQIVGLYPENGADNVGYDASNQPYFQITFDRNISSIDTFNGNHFADLDFSKGTMKIFRSSDDALIYEVTYDDWMSDIYGSEITGTISSDTQVVNGSTLRLDPFNAHLLLTAGTSYYVTVDEGFIQFEDGTVNPAIEKGTWTFTTRGEKPAEEDLSFSVARTSLTVPEGTLATPRISLRPAGASVTWASSDSGVATVGSDGTVIGVREGRATITGTATFNGQTARVSYTVRVTSGLSVAFAAHAVNLDAGDTDELDFTYRPESQVVYVTSSNPSVVTVESYFSSGGKGMATIRAIGAGTAILTIRTSRGAVELADTCTVVVESTGLETAQRFVGEALSYVGRDRNYFGFTTSWCAKFVSWCAQRAGIPSDIIPDASGTGALLAYTGDSFYFSDWEYNLAATAKLNYLASATKVTRDNFTPQPGDLVFIRWDGNIGVYPPHVGIVCAVDTASKTMTIVDGNAGGGIGIVKQRTNISYTSETIPSMDNCTLMAYARPNWAAINGIISGTKSYNINCPVDVLVSYDDEALDSATSQSAASFGTMTAAESGAISTEISGYYDTETIINGTGTGTMDFTATYRDEDGTTGVRTFTNVPITEDTVIRVVESNSARGAVALEIYTNYGETFKEIWYADSNTASVSSADQELTDWYLYGDTGESITPPDTGDDFEDNYPPVVERPSSSTSSSSSSSSRFDIDVVRPSNGTVETDPASGWKGDRVIITLTPDDGYVADSVTVTDEDGSEVDTVRRSDGSYLFYMPDGDVTIEASFVPEPEESEPTIDLSFSDVLSGTYYYDAVYWALEQGVTNGTSTTTFSPERTVTRAEMVTFLWRAAGSPEPESSTNPFTDVTSGTYYYDAVLWAVENGITNGTTATTFSPERTVTRAEAVTFQWRAAGSPAVSGGSFEDVPSNAYYAVAVEWAVGNDITNGTNPAGTLFSPEVGVSRAQAVTFLYRYLG